MGVSVPDLNLSVLAYYVPGHTITHAYKNAAEDRYRMTSSHMTLITSDLCAVFLACQP